jgi:hypothetical protein
MQQTCAGSRQYTQILSYLAPVRDWSKAMSTRVVAIVGSYRKGGVTASAVEAVLEGARQKGAVTQTIRLNENPIEFCTNCRQCTQTPGEERFKCAQDDDLEEILATIEAADAIVLGSSVNYYNVTALFRRFQERLLGYVYWPWGQIGPKLRTNRQPRNAVLVASSAAPGFLIPLATGAARALRTTARILGTKTVGHLWIGLAAGEQHHTLPARTLERARRLGAGLAS